MRFLPLLASAAMSVLLAGCGTLDPDPPKPVSKAHAPASGGVISSAASPAWRFGKGVSGFHLVTEPEEALKWRLALIDHATKSLDLQYYQWANDAVGALVFDRVLSAAERGVRVRILVDDFLYAGDEERLAALARHPNFDVRIYNPQRVRAGALGPAIEFLSRFGELNRRMHNKMLVADNRIAIMGGRNIGNYYYGLSDHYNMLDVDVIAAGPILADISGSFDEYWNSDPTYPATEMAPGRELVDTSEAIAQARERYREHVEFLSKTPYPTRPTNWSRRIGGLSSKWVPGRGTMLADEPTTDPDDPGDRLLADAPNLVNRMDSHELLLVSPYLVPTKEFYKVMGERVDHGVDIRLLAPGLGSNNQAAVHSHYRQNRRKILAMGMDLHEVREDGTDELRHFTDVAPVRAELVALHAKVGVGDRKRCFIGSVNLDPRSQEINTENGLFIESPALANQVADHVEFLMNEENAWQLELEEDGGVIWRSRGEEKRIQPGPGGMKRVSDFLLGILPIKGIL